MAIVDIKAEKLADSIMGGLDDLFTSDEERESIGLKVKQLLAKPHILNALANIEASKNTNWFVAGGRPFLLWISGVALLWNWFLRDLTIIYIVSTVDSDRAGEIVALLPTIDAAQITGLVAILLGVGGMRMLEKFRGVAREQ